MKQPIIGGCKVHHTHTFRDSGTVIAHKPRLPRIYHEFISNNSGVCVHVWAGGTFEVVMAGNDL